MAKTQDVQHYNRDSMKRFLFIILSFCFIQSGYTQNLDKMEIAKRDTLILKIAKKAVLHYGPDYYREFKVPVIEHRVLNKEYNDIADVIWEKNPGRSVYVVEYPYNEDEEYFRFDYAVKVFIWGDTGKAFKINFGNGFGIGGLDKPKSKQNPKMQRMPYKKEPPRKKSL